MKLDFQLDREPGPTKDAATIILVRDTARESGPTQLEVFVVERSKQSKFMGGAIVFPGGKVDPSDSDPAWDALIEGPKDPYAIAAARETLEEASMLHVSNVDHDTLVALRNSLAEDPNALRAFLKDRGLKLDLTALLPFSRWITPTAESRRFDARFFIAAAPPNQPGAHDQHETTSSFWATPAEILRRWEAGDVILAPPTHATLLVLARAKNVADALAAAAKSTREPIMPKLVKHGETLALTLPGDPAHEVKESRVDVGGTRYVLHGERWLPENAP